MLRQQRQRQVAARIADKQRLRAEVMNGANGRSTMKQVMPMVM
jgi:hypothetical protein